LTAAGEVNSVDIRGETLTVKISQPASFFPRIGQIVVEHGFAIERLQTLDTGADAVFNYLQRGVA
jgi:hypothetical protein